MRTSRLFRYFSLCSITSWACAAPYFAVNWPCSTLSSGISWPYSQPAYQSEQTASATCGTGAAGDSERVRCWREGQPSLAGHVRNTGAEWRDRRGIQGRRALASGLRSGSLATTARRARSISVYCRSISYDSSV
eukprot:scaffold5696_cov119-Isochrysis_galbana.AAC.11